MEKVTYNFTQDYHYTQFSKQGILGEHVKYNQYIYEIETSRSKSVIFCWIKLSEYIAVAEFDQTK